MPSGILLALVMIVFRAAQVLSVIFAGCSIQSKIIVENFELVFNIGVGLIAAVFVGFGIYYTKDLLTAEVAFFASLLIVLLVLSVLGVIMSVSINE